MQGSNQVRLREDKWVEVESQRTDGFTDGPLQLRPGTDDSKIRLKVDSALLEQEVEIGALEAGIEAIRKEHER